MSLGMADNFSPSSRDFHSGRQYSSGSPTDILAQLSGLSDEQKKALLIQAPNMGLNQAALELMCRAVDPSGHLRAAINREEAARAERERIENQKRKDDEERRLQELASVQPTLAIIPASRQQWYYSIDGRTRKGPVPTREICQFASEGVLQPQHLISCDGRKWYRARKVMGLSWPGKASV